MTDKQIQKSGEGSTNVQANSMTVNIGIDEKRAREIYSEMNLQVRQQYSQEAVQVAKKRVDEFEAILIPKMEKLDGALEAFGDPSFQLLLLEAQKTAAATERPADYDLLSELLIHRFQKGSDRMARTGINRAVEIVDEISDDALLGLTVSHAVSHLTPVTGNIIEGLGVLDNLFGKILYGKLPNDSAWLDQLDLLDAVRLSTFGSMKKIEQYYPEKLSGYVDVGIKRDSEKYTKAVEILHQHTIPSDILVTHELDNGFVRINVPNISAISSIVIRRTQSFGSWYIPKETQVPLSDAQVRALKSVYELYEQDDNKKQDNVKSLMGKWDSRPHLKELREWWDNIGIVFQITAVGRVLAHSNAQRCDSTLPPIS